MTNKTSTATRLEKTAMHNETRAHWVHFAWVPRDTEHKSRTLGKLEPANAICLQNFQANLTPTREPPKHSTWQHPGMFNQVMPLGSRTLGRTGAIQNHLRTHPHQKTRFYGDPLPQGNCSGRHCQGTAMARSFAVPLLWWCHGSAEACRT